MKKKNILVNNSFISIKNQNDFNIYIKYYIKLTNSIYFCKAYFLL